MNATALIAEDEPLLARALVGELGRAWPELDVLATVGNGTDAVAEALRLQPQILFLDIRMPGLNGLEVAAELADAWHSSGPPFPFLVFITAYDQYAVQAFEAQAMDYVLKPVEPARLRATVKRIQQQWPARYADTAPQDFERTLQRLQTLLSSHQPSGGLAGEPLQMIQASVGPQIRMIPVAEVLVIEAADKYLRVLTSDAEVLLRTPLKDLLPKLNPHDFWQIHRGTVVRASTIDRVVRDDVGRLSLYLKGRSERWSISRLYAGRFKAM